MTDDLPTAAPAVVAPPAPTTQPTPRAEDPEAHALDPAPGRDTVPGRDASHGHDASHGRDTTRGRGTSHGHEPAAPALTGGPQDADPRAGAARLWAAVVTRVRGWSYRQRLVVAGVVTVLLLGGAAVVGQATADAPTVDVTLNEALDTIASGDVVEAALRERAGVLALTLGDGTVVEAGFPTPYADEITEALLEQDVALTTRTAGASSAGQDVLLRVLVGAVLIGLLVLAVRVARTGGALPAGRGKKALTSGEIPDVTFEHVAGADEAVDQLREMVQLLREPDRFAAVGATRPRGALLVGPPGTGKTLLARAVAGEAGVPFFAIAGSDFVETYVGVGARRVRDLFAEARKAERAIIFIDEIDAVGRARSNDPQHSNDGERENTLISLLNEMDGFAGSSVLVLAATNRPDTLDTALTRPGRLDRQVHVPNPDRRGRTLILEVHARNRPLADDVDLVQVARQTPGMSGADLAQVVDEACMEAARRGQDVVDASCFQAAVATVAMGRARTSALVTDFDRRVTAWHEAGHTLAAALLPEADDPVSVTIVPRGPAGGVTWMSGNDDIFLPRRKALAQLVVALAGRAAEERLLDGEHTQGASGDLQSATNLATAMVTKYGMTDFGYAQVDDDTMRVGGQVAARAHAKIDGLLRDAHEKAVALLADHAAELEAVAATLLAEETLSLGRVRQVMEQARATAA